LSKILVALLLIVSTSACVRAQAKAPVATPGLATPGLATPEPPERLIVPSPLPEAAAPAPPPPTNPRPRDPVAASRPSERTPTQATPAPAPPAPAAASSDPPPVHLLQTTANPAEVEKQTRAQLSVAQRDLDRAAGRQLSANGRVQYDTARAFIRQADDALKAGNLALARELADKAASLASQLAR
jgi:hypothetical protein